MNDGLTAGEWEQFVTLLQRFAEHELDQHDARQVDTSYGPVFVRISRVPGPDEPAEAFRHLAGLALQETGRFAHVDDIQHVASRDDVLRVLAEMRSDLAGAGAAEWENPTLGRCLEALGGFLGGIDGYFANRAEPAPAQPSWSLLATAEQPAATRALINSLPTGEGGQLRH